MKILAFTDVHENLSAFKKIEKKASQADLLICAGDLTMFEMHIGPMMKRLSKIKKPTLMIPGNHETSSVLKKYCSFHKNIIYIHKKLHKYKDYYFLGWGGGGFSYVEQEFEQLIKKINIKGKKVILVTHAPPYNTKVDIIGKTHYGNKSIIRYLKQNKNIIMNICGHFHETWGKKDKVNNTLLINPGPKGEILTL